ncbi:MAG: universal stress protein [Alphaproteobacteria bacterium]|nr:universal stress protein [Alphaproteobacteria bacterium]
MSFKKIIVPVIGAGGDAVALATAFAAARLFSGHVEALFVRPDPRETAPFGGMPVSAEVVQQIIQNAEELATAGANAARAYLDAAAKAAGAERVAHPVPAKGVTCSFRETHGAFAAQIAQAARLADLIVFAPDAPRSGPDLHGAFIETLTRCARPVLLSAAAPPADLVRKIAIGWDGSAAAAHALSAALPLLAAAGAVEIVCVRAPSVDTASADDAAAYLALHGISAATRLVDPGGQQPAVALLNAAVDGGASLLVAGGYGHSRLFETLFGGTTVHIAAHATLPLFMVH